MPTLLELSVDKLDGNLAVRKRELTDLRLLVATTSGQRGQSMRRAAHVAAYAHWEGFTKFAISTYLEYICLMKPMVSSLRPQLKALSYLDAIRAAANDGKSLTNAINLIEAVDMAAVRGFSVHAQELVKTGNLLSEKLETLLCLSGLDYLNYYATKANLIDQSLCGRRHRIAHGSLEPVTEQDSLDMIDLVSDLCDTLNEQIQEALIYDAHLVR